MIEYGRQPVNDTLAVEVQANGERHLRVARDGGGQVRVELEDVPALAEALTTGAIDLLLIVVGMEDPMLGSFERWPVAPSLVVELHQGRDAHIEIEQSPGERVRIELGEVKTLVQALTTAAIDLVPVVAGDPFGYNGRERDTSSTGE
jgi:hypothetical protein